MQRHVRRLRVLAIAGVVAMTMAILPASPVTAREVGNEAACTPGYWKNHTDNWLEDPGNLIPTTKKVGDAFGAVATAFPELADDTFLEALNYGGGRGELGAAKILLRHAVAAFLNAAYDDDAGNLAYPLRRHTSTSFYPDFGGIVPEVNEALMSGDRDAMLQLKDFLDGIANSLPCPLN